MKYDDASWHYGGDFPADLPEEAGATHTGMYVAWALLAGLSGDIHITDFPEDIPKEPLIYSPLFRHHSHIFQISTHR